MTTANWQIFEHEFDDLGDAIVDLAETVFRRDCPDFLS